MKQLFLTLILLAFISFILSCHFGLCKQGFLCLLNFKIRSWVQQLIIQSSVSASSTRRVHNFLSWTPAMGQLVLCTVEFFDEGRPIGSFILSLSPPQIIRCSYYLRRCWLSTSALITKHGFRMTGGNKSSLLRALSIVENSGPSLNIFVNLSKRMWTL